MKIKGFKVSGRTYKPKKKEINAFFCYIRKMIEVS
jgi:hypothetical protein